jgi:hypothetical protein
MSFAIVFISYHQKYSVFPDEKKLNRFAKKAIELQTLTVKTLVLYLSLCGSGVITQSPTESLGNVCESEIISTKCAALTNSIS